MAWRRCVTGGANGLYPGGREGWPSGDVIWLGSFRHPGRQSGEALTEPVQWLLKEPAGQPDEAEHARWQMERPGNSKKDDDHRSYREP